MLELIWEVLCRFLVLEFVDLTSLPDLRSFTTLTYLGFKQDILDKSMEKGSSLKKAPLHVNRFASEK